MAARLVAGKGIMNQACVPRNKTVISRVSWAMQDVLPDSMHRSTKAFLWALPIIGGVFLWDELQDPVVPKTLTPEWKEAQIERQRAIGANPYTDPAATLKTSTVPPFSADNDNWKILEEMDTSSDIGKMFIARN